MNHPTNDEQAIARELAALGEAPPTADELLLARSGNAPAELDVRNVGALFGIAYPPAHVDGELLELQRRRVWKTVVERGAPLLKAAPAPTPERWWRVVVGAVAVAAGVLLVPRLAPPTELPSEAAREDLQATGQSARAAVETLPGPVGSERAQAMAQEYAQRLASARAGAVEVER